MAVKIIRNVILCHGRGLLLKSVLNVEAIWSKREASWFAQMKPVAMLRI